VQRETPAAVHAELRQALSSAPAPRSGPPLDPVAEARLLLAVVDGLMLDAYLDRLMPGDHAAARSRRPGDV
jgi:hypothetical protein